MRGRQSLFDVLSRAPQTERGSRSGRKPWFRRRSPNAFAPIGVAEPLTEEEAAVELAAERAAREDADRLKREKRESKLALKAAKRAAKAQARIAALETARQTAARMTARGPRDGRRPPSVSVAGGRLFLSLSSAWCMVGAACVCVLLIGAFSLGRRSAGAVGGSGLPPAAALSDDSMTRLAVELESPAGRAEAPAEKPHERADLSALLRPPGAMDSSAKANQPATIASASMGASPEASKMNYLVVQEFLVTREKSSEQLAQELDDARRFLGSHGVETFARRLSKGFRLCAGQGFAPGKDQEPLRENFRRRIEQLGRAYRSGGGLYDFRGCFFMDYERATSGKPL